MRGRRGLPARLQAKGEAARLDAVVVGVSMAVQKSNYTAFLRVEPTRSSTRYRRFSQSPIAARGSRTPLHAMGRGLNTRDGRHLGAGDVVGCGLCRANDENLLAVYFVLMNGATRRRPRLPHRRRGAALRRRRHGLAGAERHGEFRRRGALCSARRTEAETSGEGKKPGHGPGGRGYPPGMAPEGDSDDDSDGDFDEGATSDEEALPGFSSTSIANWPVSQPRSTPASIAAAAAANATPETTRPDTSWPSLQVEVRQRRAAPQRHREALARHAHRGHRARDGERADDALAQLRVVVAPHRVSVHESEERPAIEIWSTSNSNWAMLFVCVRNSAGEAATDAARPPTTAALADSMRSANSSTSTLHFALSSSSGVALRRRGRQRCGACCSALAHASIAYVRIVAGCHPVCSLFA